MTDQTTDAMLPGERPLLERMLSSVHRFQTEIIDYPIPPKPTVLSDERKQWAHTVLTEELEEFLEATTVEDQADALVDFIYFALGRMVEMGLAPGPFFDEVHRANMDKERGEKPTRSGSGGFDAIKPEGWNPPDFSELLGVTVQDWVWASAHRRLTLARQRRAIRAFRPKIMIMGHARHGKDTACEILQRVYGLDFESSSRFIADRIIQGTPFYLDQGYSSPDEAFEDRGNHRQAWYELISAFNTPDKSALGSALFAEYDIYCGVRSAEEYWALRNREVFDVAIWISAEDRVPPEASNSCTVAPWMADFMVYNNQSEAELEVNLCALMDRLIPELEARNED